MREQHNSHQDIPSMSLPTPVSSVVPASPVSQISRSQSFPFAPDYHHKRPREHCGPPTVGLPNVQFPPVPQQRPNTTQQQQHLSLQQQLPPVQPPGAVPNGTPTKKKRSNNYVAPKKIPLTFNSQVGAATAAAAGGLRRQLSSSKIETFLSSGDDSMDVEVETSRPRSMSL